MRHLRTLGLSFLALAAAPVLAQTATDAAAPRAMVVNMQRHSAGTFYVNGEIAGYGEMRFLVDTGSSYMVINQQVLDTLTKAGKVQPLREVSGLMADGTRRVIPTYQIESLKLGEACWVADVEAAVISGNTRPILGMDVLARLAPFTFSTEPAQLVVNRCQAAPGLQTAAEKTAVPRTAVAGSEKISGGEGVKQ